MGSRSIHKTFEAALASTRSSDGIPEDRLVVSIHNNILQNVIKATRGGIKFNNAFRRGSRALQR